MNESCADIFGVLSGYRTITHLIGQSERMLPHLVTWTTLLFPASPSIIMGLIGLRVVVQIIAPMSVKLSDIAGRVINEAHGKGNVSIDVRNLAAGIYIVDVLSSGKRTVQKITAAH